MKHCDKIMIVEDDAGIRHYLQSTLSNAGYDTVAVGGGRSALALAASHCPDCVLLDLGLPDMDGIGIIQSIRRVSRAHSFLGIMPFTSYPFIMLQPIIPCCAGTER